jgi:hypothetical protein
MEIIVRPASVLRISRRLHWRAIGGIPSSSVLGCRVSQVMAWCRKVCGVAFTPAASA